MATGQETLDRDILPRVFSSLDSVFPEFGWKRTRAGWVATNSKFTKQAFGARADRCISRMQAGFLIHGDRSYHWLEYLTGGAFPRGQEWWRIVAELGARVGVDVALSSATSGGKAPARHRCVAALADALVHTDRVAAYLAHRKARLPEGVIVGELPDEPTELLRRAGFSRGEVEDEAQIVRDYRWEARVCSVWRDQFGRPASLWGRAFDDAVTPKYLILSGETPPLFGAEVAVLASLRHRVPHGVIGVEGMFDRLSLQAAGFEETVGLGRNGLTLEALKILERAGSATLLLDADSAGSAGTLKSVEAWAFAHSPVRLSVATVDGAKDPDVLLQVAGPEGVLACLERRVPAASAYIESRLAEPGAVAIEVARAAVPFLASVGVCHPLEAAAATELLVAAGVPRSALRLATGQLSADELTQLRASLLLRLQQVDDLLKEETT